MFEADNTTSVQELANILNQWARDANRKDPQGIITDPLCHVFAVGNQEMLKIAEDGFWVRGKRVTVDQNEAAVVYGAFRQWLTWAELSRD